MNRKTVVLALTFIAGAIVGHFGIPAISSHPGQAGTVMAQSRKPIYALRLFTGSDNKTHAEKVEMKFSSTGAAEASNLLPVTHAELYRTFANSTHDWHHAPRRQYVITLSGHGEIELEDGEKFLVGPGDIDLVEDTTGKGHITRVVGNEDRVTLQLHIADQAGK